MEIEGQHLSAEKRLESKMPELNVVFTIDERFIQHFTATMVSILENNKDLKVNIFVLHSVDNQAFLTEVISFIKHKYVVDIKCIYVQNSYFESYRISLHYSKAVYYRLIITELIPSDIKVVLFLDADVIVNGSLKELAAYEFSDGEFLMAAENISDEDNIGRLNKLGFPVTKYFNAGVLLINVKVWREEKISPQLLEMANKYMDKIDWWDQDILNMFFYDKRTVMDSRYNALVYAETLPDNPIIIHYAGKEKPWLYVYEPPYKSLYWKYLKLTPFKNEQYIDYTFKEFLRRYYIKILDTFHLRTHDPRKRKRS